MNINLLTGADELIRRFDSSSISWTSEFLYLGIFYFIVSFLWEMIYVIFICIRNKAGLIQIDLY